MFGLEGSGFIVAIAVTLLLAGAIVYYCNTRITAMEKAIVKQNQVLADFIGNVRNTLTNVPSGPVQQQSIVANGATQEAVDAANDYYSNTTPENKIEVSDDSQSEDDSESESDSDLDSDSDDDDTNENEKIQEVSENIAVSDLLNVVQGDMEIGVIGIAMTPPDGPPPPEMPGPEITEITEITDIDEVNPQQEIKTIKLGDVKDEEELESVTLNSETLSSVSNGTSDEEEEEEEEDTSTVNSQVVTELNDETVMKLRVAKLRELAVEMELGSEDSIKKTKKAALQEMIKNKINNTEE